MREERSVLFFAEIKHVSSIKICLIDFCYFFCLTRPTIDMLSLPFTLRVASIWIWHHNAGWGRYFLSSFRAFVLTLTFRLGERISSYWPLWHHGNCPPNDLCIFIRNKNTYDLPCDRYIRQSILFSLHKK